MTSPLIVGFLTSFTLIAAIGAQNAFVLRQGIRREHVLAVVSVCALSDLVLITAGIAGIGVLVTAHPQTVTIAKVGGAAFLFGYGALAARRALRPSTMAPTDDGSARLISVLATCLALTFLNPHVYLDTVLMLGNIANQHGVTGRWWFAAGAGVASIAWFTTLGFGARALSGPLSRPRTWQVLDTLIGLVMLTLAVVLLRS